MQIPNKTILNSAASRLVMGAMTPAERVCGRYMRSPDGHEGGAPAPSPSPSPTPAPAPSPDPAPADDDDGDDTLLGGKPADDAGDPKPEDKDGDDKGDGAPQPRPGAPEKYELKVADALAEKGVTFDTDAFEAVEPVFRELGLSNDEAQKFVDSYAEKVLPKLAERSDAAMLDRAKTQRKEWLDAAKADPEIGGENHDAAMTAVAKAFDHYGIKKGEGVRQLLDESGLGNHPDLVRFMARVGRDLAEGGFERGDPVPTTKSAEQKLYDDAFQPKK